MKKLNWIDKLIFFVNSLLAAMLLLSYLLPYLQPESFALLSVLSLAVPVLIILNFLCFLYWLLKVKKQLMLSLFVLLLGYSYLSSLYKFSGSKDEHSEGELSVLSYNVRLFNLYNWIDNDAVASEIVDFVKEESPDVLSFQEYHPHKDVNFSNYKYNYKKLAGKKTKHGQVIYSKFPIINSGSIEFPNSANNAIFTDIVKSEDTIRIYNVHLQSSSIDPNVEDLDSEESKARLNQLKKTFKLQQSQAEKVQTHISNSPYKVIVSGDFNNTAYSYVYRIIRGDLNDAFEEAGNGFGRTFAFKYFPVRIDFILADEVFQVNSFKTFDQKLSDHFPVYARFSLKK